MPQLEKAPEGIDLNPLGWNDLRTKFVVPEDGYLDIPLDTESMISLKKNTGYFYDGIAREVFILALGEKISDKVLMSTYRVIGGILTEAAVLSGDKTTQRSDIKKARLADTDSGMLNPTDDDATKLINLLRKASEQQLNG